jgi:hypothetical protein
MIERGMPARFIAALAVLLLLLALPVPAAAHLTPNSEIRLDLAPGAIVADIVVPQSEFGYATGLATDNRPASLAARAYLLGHFAVVAPDGRQLARRSTGSRSKRSSARPISMPRPRCCPRPAPATAASASTGASSRARFPPISRCW